MEKHRHQKKGHETTKNKPCFYLFLGHAFRVPKNLEDNFSAVKSNKRPTSDNGPKSENTKIGKPYLSLFFFNETKRKSYKRPGGGLFFHRARSTATFSDPFLEGPVSKVQCTQAILCYKNSGLGTF